MSARNDPRDVILRRSKRMPNGCREWQGPLHNSGYGRISVNDRLELAHRVAYEAFRGPIPEGAVLDHVVCDNRACCDHWHVEPRTHRENILRGRGAAAANARKTHCVHGHPLSGNNLGTIEGRHGNPWRFCWTCRLRRSRARAKVPS